MNKDKEMKKFFIIAVVAITTIVGFSACTGNQRARYYGGNQTIKLKAGEKLVEATWKENSLWYLTEPMDSDYVPKTKVFREDSSFGIVEGTVTFVESR